MRNQYSILKEAYEQIQAIPVKGKYIYFVDGNELYQINPYKEIQPEGMIMTMGNNWRKALVMHGEDIRDVLGQQVGNVNSWYEVGNQVPMDHAFVVYIGT